MTMSEHVFSFSELIFSEYRPLHYLAKFNAFSTSDEVVSLLLDSEANNPGRVVTMKRYLLYPSFGCRER